MKKNGVFAGIMLSLSLVLIVPGLQAQEKDENISKQQIETPDFDRINAGGAFRIFLEQAPQHKVVIETDANVMQHIIVDVVDDELRLKTKGLRKFSTLNAYISMPNLKGINLHGAAELQTQNTFKVNEIELISSGASESRMMLEADKIMANASGASEVKLSGKTTELMAGVSGAADFKAGDLMAEYAAVNASGASHASVYATKELSYDESGAADISVAKLSPVKKSGQSDEYSIGVDIEEDEESVSIKNMKVQVDDNNDTTNIRVGNHIIVVDDDGNVQYKKTRKVRKFNGHWAGFELGVNGYLTPDYDMNFGQANDYLDLNMAKSIKVGINLFEQNLSLTRNQKLGLVTGLGWEVNNYRFDDNVSLVSDSSKIMGFYNKGVAVSKSKLVVSYLEIPLLLEFQNNTHKKSHDFHFAAGLVFGLRVCSHTKQVFEENNKEYTWIDPTPPQEEVTGLVLRSPGDDKAKNHDDFHLNPFKADATVRLGWGWVNLFGTYSITTLFRENRGPELYPFSVGLTIVGW